MITPESFARLLEDHGDFIGNYQFALETATADSVILRLRFDPTFLRPGGTISGPTFFVLADITMWILAIGASPNGLMSMTTDMSLHFLRATRDKDLLAHGRLMPKGDNLLVFSVAMIPDGETDPACHATGTYSVPRASRVPEIAAGAGA